MGRINYFAACVLSTILSAAFFQGSGDPVFDLLPDEELTTFLAKQEAQPTDHVLLARLRKEKRRRDTSIARIVRLFR